MKNLLLFFTIIFSSFALISCASTKVENNIQEEQEIEQQSDEIQLTTEEEEEYSRSTTEVSVTREVFNADKNAILQIIEELSVIMTNADYNKWITYIEPDSVTYWSSPRNLSVASKRLPSQKKQNRLVTLYDYFRRVFIPSRQGRKVDEIRYVSVNQVKAVQVNGDQDIVYYNFIKINDKWMVKLPKL